MKPIKKEIEYDVSPSQNNNDPNDAITTDDNRTKSILLSGVRIKQEEIVEDDDNIAIAIQQHQVPQESMKQSMKDDNDDVTLLNRDYITIGIGNVFISTSPIDDSTTTENTMDNRQQQQQQKHQQQQPRRKHVLACQYLKTDVNTTGCNNKNENDEYDSHGTRRMSFLQFQQDNDYEYYYTDELIGTIKQSPEDFIVREILHFPSIDNYYQLNNNNNTIPISYCTHDDRIVIANINKHGRVSNNIVQSSKPTQATKTTTTTKTTTAQSTNDNIQPNTTLHATIEPTNQIQDKEIDKKQQQIFFLKLNDYDSPYEYIHAVFQRYGTGIIIESDPTDLSTNSITESATQQQTSTEITSLLQTSSTTTASKLPIPLIPCQQRESLSILNPTQSTTTAGYYSSNDFARTTMEYLQNLQTIFRTSLARQSIRQQQQQGQMPPNQFYTITISFRTINRTNNCENNGTGTISMDIEDDSSSTEITTKRRKKYSATDTTQVTKQTIVPNESPVIKNQNRVEFDLTEFHDAVRSLYPLLKANAVTTPGGVDTSIPTATSIDGSSYQLCMTVDTYWNELVPYLYQPEIDLPILIQFYKAGYKPESHHDDKNTTTATANLECETNNQQESDRKKKNKNDYKRSHYRPDHKKSRIRPKQHEQATGDETTPSYTNTRPILLLHPDLPKDKRRDFHQIIARKSKSLLHTYTIPNHPLPSKQNLNNDCQAIPLMTEERDPVQTNDVLHDNRQKEFNQQQEQYPSSIAKVTKTTTAAIVITWTKTAERKYYNKKRKMDERCNDPGTDNNGSTTPHNRQESSCYKNNTKNYAASTLLCVVRKRQREHNAAIRLMTKAFHCRQSDIGFAGIKDMMAITYQFCTIKDVSLERFRAAISSLRLEGIDVQHVPTNTGVEDNSRWSLRKGNLAGNEFEIIIRNVHRIVLEKDSDGQLVERFVPICGDANYTDAYQQLEERVHRVRDNGFVNFYGEQRVGEPGHEAVTGVRAFDIGRAILQHKFMEAIDLILTGRRMINGIAIDEIDDELINVNSESGRNNPECGGVTSSIRRFREHWKQSGGNVDSTMKLLPRSQSLLLRERVVLKGLKRYGKDNPLAAFRCLHPNDRVFYVNAYQSYVWNLMTTERLRLYGNKVVEGDLILRKGHDEVELITFDNQKVLDGLNIYDVVLPLPGYDVQYPNNQIGKMYKSFLENDCIILDKKDIELKEEVSRGSYRHIIVRPINDQVEVCQLPKQANSDSEQKQSKDVKLKFQLPKGCYATMFLREVMLSTVARAIEVNATQRDFS